MGVFCIGVSAPFSFTLQCFVSGSRYTILCLSISNYETGISPGLSSGGNLIQAISCTNEERPKGNQTYEEQGAALTLRDGETVGAGIVARSQNFIQKSPEAKSQWLLPSRRKAPRKRFNHCQRYHGNQEGKGRTTWLSLSNIPLVLPIGSNY